MVALPWLILIKFDCNCYYINNSNYDNNYTNAYNYCIVYDCFQFWLQLFLRLCFSYDVNDYTYDLYCNYNCYYSNNSDYIFDYDYAYNKNFDHSYVYICNYAFD